VRGVLLLSLVYGMGYGMWWIDELRGLRYIDGPGRKLLDGACRNLGNAWLYFGGYREFRSLSEGCCIWDGFAGWIDGFMNVGRESSVTLSLGTKWCEWFLVFLGEEMI
jgi:hypothetical protein